MIFYYSGTGNSAYIAKRLAEKLGDELVHLNKKLKENDTATMIGTERIIFVTPTYAWRVPRIVTEWIAHTRIRGVKDVWFVMNCGSEIGNPGKYLIPLCDQKGWNYKGVYQVTMPENYIAMFNAPDEARTKEIIAAADPVIDYAANMIEKGRVFPPVQPSLKDCFVSGVVNPIFYKFFVKADAFVVSDACIGCGKCEKLCPANTIKMVNGKPKWEENCTHCMACICHCPASAIEYGKKTVGKPRYHID